MLLTLARAELSQEFTMRNFPMLSTALLPSPPLYSSLLPPYQPCAHSAVLLSLLYTRALLLKKHFCESIVT
jgi:hypothetical protein